MAITQCSSTDAQFLLSDTIKRSAVLSPDMLISNHNELGLTICPKSPYTNICLLNRLSDAKCTQQLGRSL